MKRNMSELNRHNTTVEVIARVSARFKALASPKYISQGDVFIYGDDDEARVKQVIKDFLSNGETSLTLTNWPTEMFPCRCCQTPIIVFTSPVVGLARNSTL